MDMRPCAHTEVRAQSTGGGSGLPKLLARWTVGGEEGLGQRGIGGGWTPSFIGPLHCQLPPYCSHLLGQVPCSESIQTPPAVYPSPKHTLFIQGLFLEHPWCGWNGE